MLSLLLVEDHREMRAALRDWLLTQAVAPSVRVAGSLDEALLCATGAAAARRARWS